MKRITTLLSFLLIAFLALLPLSGEAQSISRNKKQQTTKTTKKSKQGSSSNNGGKSKKTSKNTAQQSPSKSNASTPSSRSASESTQQVFYTPKVETFTVNGVSFDMIWVEGGTFRLGAHNEQSTKEYNMWTHNVTLSNYYIGKYEVTQELWQAVMGNNPSYFKGDVRRPVEQVSWTDCQTFISRLNQLTGKSFRLPTHAESEYAARGGKWTKGFKYSGSSSIAIVAWYYRNSDKTTHPVGTKAPNELGLYDMSGNVWEWCQDWYDYDSYYYSPPLTNPKGPSSGDRRMYHGGCWESHDYNCKVVNSGFKEPSNMDNTLGLRLAL